MRVAIALVAVLAAGCFGSLPQAPRDVDVAYDEATGLYNLDAELADGSHVRVDYAPGAISRVMNAEGVNNVEFDAPLGWIPLAPNGGRFEVPGRTVLASGESAEFLLPPAAPRASLLIDHGFQTTDLPLDMHPIPGVQPNKQLVSGENTWNLSAYQEANFPRRIAGSPTYDASIAYFADYFRELGYEVEVDPYGFTGVDTPCPVGLTGGAICPETFSNVVAWKPGAEDPDKVLFVAGGHFDMVEGTTHAAIDNTAGTVATLELARAMAPYTFRNTIMFGLWGGEEAGLLGASFWMESHPEMRSRILYHWNLDGVGMAWPTPLPRPDPILLAAGPDAPSAPPAEGQAGDPISQSLLTWAQTLHEDWMQYPAELTSPRDGDSYPFMVYEGVASGQASGYNGYNAQSDHTAFIAAGIPSYFTINADYDSGASWPVQSHTEKDTLNNLTKYAYYAEDFDIEDPTWESPEAEAAARQAMADGWEPYLWFPFYTAVLVDLGIYQPPAAAAAAPAGT